MYHSLLRLKDLIPEATRAVSSMVNWDGEAQEKKFLRSVYQGNPSFLHKFIYLLINPLFRFVPKSDGCADTNG